jgi:hypothetical protein
VCGRRLEELFIMKVWITDGSGAPFTDLGTLPTWHRGMMGRDVPYKGALDESVPVGDASVSAADPADCLVPEAEWCICFPEGTDRFVADPDALTESTPVIMQGLIEGKWLNRFDQDLAWKPASLGNNLLARGPGIPGTLASLENGGMRGEIRVQYAGRAGRLTYSAALSDLRGHHLLDLARAVFRYCREHNLTVEAVDCGALGPASAVFEDEEFLQRVVTAAGVTQADLSGQAAWRKVASEISRIAYDEGLIVQPGTPIDVVVTSGAHMIGRGQLTIHPAQVVG